MYTLKSVLECLECFVFADVKIICCIFHLPKAYPGLWSGNQPTKTFFCILYSSIFSYTFFS